MTAVPKSTHAQRHQKDGSDSLGAYYRTVTEGPLDAERYVTDITGASDQTTGLQAWLNALSSGSGQREGLFRGQIRHDSGLVLPVPVAGLNPSSRAGGLTIRGENMYASVLLNNSNDYAMTASGGELDAATFADFCVKSSTGGGINVGNNTGNLTFERFFQDGCGAGLWGIRSDIGYPVTIDGCRFWNETFGYLGGAFNISGAFALGIRNTFVSRIMKNAEACIIEDCVGVSINDLMLESIANGSAFTAQKMLSFQGTNEGVWIGILRGEMQANTLIDIASASAVRGMSIEAITLVERDDATLGDPNILIIDTHGVQLDTRARVGSISFTGQSMSAGGVLVNDPFNSIKVENFLNLSDVAASSPNQAARSLKRWPDPSVGARVHNAAGQTLANGGPTTLTYDTEDFDSDDFFWDPARPTQFVVPNLRGGMYEINATLALTGTGGHRRAFIIEKNFANIATDETDAPNAATVPRYQVSSGAVLLAAGDIITFAFYQDSGGSLASGTGVSDFWASLARVSS